MLGAYADKSAQTRRLVYQICSELWAPLLHVWAKLGEQNWADLRDEGYSDARRPHYRSRKMVVKSISLEQPTRKQFWRLKVRKYADIKQTNTDLKEVCWELLYLHSLDAHKNISSFICVDLHLLPNTLRVVWPQERDLLTFLEERRWTRPEALRLVGLSL